MKSPPDPPYSKSQSTLLSILNWPNGKIALACAIVFIAGVIYRVYTGRGDIYDATINFSAFMWGAVYFRTLSIFTSVIHKIHASHS